MEEIAEKYRLKFLHMIVTVVGLPIILAMGGIIGTLILSQVSDMRSDLRTALTTAGSNKENVAVLNENQRGMNVRLSRIEDWRESFTGRN